MATILRGPPWSAEEMAAILRYCESDVLLLERILLAMLPRIDLPHALLRGRFMKAAAAIEWNGVPIDTATLALLRKHWTGIQDELIAEIDRGYGVFEGRSFRRERWQQWLTAHGIPWPTTETGQLKLDDDTFRAMAKIYPEVSPMRELRSALSELRLERSRGRRRWSRSHHPVGVSIAHRPLPALQHQVHLRSQRLAARPDQAARRLGRCLYRLVASRNLAIAAKLSGDEVMKAAYRSGDPYLAFAKQAGLVPADATKQTHGAMRELCKQCVLGVAYGMEAHSLAQRIGQPVIVARDLLRAHRETYRKFWAWSDAMVDRAMMGFPLWTTLGWPLRIGSDPNPRSMRNFCCQANGAEMLRLAACFATEQGIEVCALIHDAVLIAAPLDRLDHDIERMQAAMAKASRVVLDGFELRTDVNVIRYPDRYQDPRGAGDVGARDGSGGQTRGGRTGGGRMMDGPDDIDIEKLRVDPDISCSRPASRSGRDGSDFARWCRGRGSCGCWKRNGSAPTAWRSSCSICTGTARASRSPSLARWRPRPSFPIDPNQMRSPSSNGWA